MNNSVYSHQEGPFEEKPSESGRTKRIILILIALGALAAYFFTPKLSAQTLGSEVRALNAETALTVAEHEAVGTVKVADVNVEVRVAQAKLALAKAEAELKIIKATADSEADRLRHKPAQEREDNEVVRDNSRDDHRPVYSYYGSSYYSGSVSGYSGGFAANGGCNEGGCNTTFTTGGRQSNSGNGYWAQGMWVERP